MRDQQKVLRKAFREYGAVVEPLHGNFTGTRYRFPDGAAIEVPANASPSWAAAQCRFVRERYGRIRRDNASLSNRSGKPRIDLEQLRASEHAKERLRLMQGQGSVSFQEVLHAIRLPQQVLWSDVHESWVWIRDRIAVCISADGHTITTVMWSTNDLFEQYPRPKEAS